jgi:glycosyltransferase involved in cell wall biosynthesis
LSGARISLITEIPAPFRIPLFNTLAAHRDVDLTVHFLSDRDPKRPYALYTHEFRYRWHVLPRRELVRGGRWVILNRGVLRALRRARPEMIVIGGWNQPAFWSAAAYARATHTPLVAWVESTERDERPGTGPLELAKRALIRACSGFLVPGSASRAYLRALGVPDGRIVTAPNAVDAGIFRAQVDALRTDNDALRARLGLAGIVFLYVGRLDPEKGVHDLLEAMRGLSATLAIVGSGSQDRELRAEAPPNVRFAGRLSREDLPEWYAAADAFVLPSRSDQWGMVLNEAAEAGLPLVATEAPGGAYDLIDHGVSGFRVPVGDPRALADALARVAADEPFRAAAGARSRELAAQHTPEAWADAVASLAQRYDRPACSRRRPSTG